MNTTTPPTAEIERIGKCCEDALVDAASFMGGVKYDAVKEGWWTEWDTATREKITVALTALTQLPELVAAKDRELAEAKAEAAALSAWLYQFAHVAWHALDDSEDCGDDGQKLMRQDSDELETAVMGVFGDDAWSEHPRPEIMETHAPLATALLSEHEALKKRVVELEGALAFADQTNAALQQHMGKTIPKGCVAVCKLCRMGYINSPDWAAGCEHGVECPLRASEAV